jgi:two-component system copper resistance phosphate regulon response regulator CusR
MGDIVEAASYRILCIEDDAETRVLLKRSLESAGMSVDAVWSGDKGVEAAMNGAFDCVLVDLLMPGMDGYQVIRALKSQGLTGKMPVVVLTAREDEESRERALAAGADSYIVKPFEIGHLTDEIRTLVDQSRS